MIGKNNFLIISLILNLLFISSIFFGVMWADTNGVWNLAKDIRGGIFGEDEQTQNMNFTFINPVYFLDNLYSYSNAYFINISGRTQLNDLNAQKIAVNYGEVHGNLIVSNKVLADNIRDKRCVSGEVLVGFDHDGNIICEVSYTYVWVENNDWSVCTELCGGGIQTQTVDCMRNDGLIVNDSYCNSLTKPSETRECNVQACIEKTGIARFNTNCASITVDGTYLGTITCGSWDTINNACKLDWIASKLGYSSAELIYENGAWGLNAIAACGGDYGSSFKIRLY